MSQATRLIIKQAALVVLIVFAFGVCIPWLKGFDFFDPILILAYALLALLFVAPASAEAFASGRVYATRRAALARMGAVLAYGWGVAALILAAGIATVNLANRGLGLVLPSPKLLAAVLLLSLAASLDVIVSAALLARRFAARSVKSILRLGFLVALFALAFGYRALPGSWRASVAEHMTTRGILHFSLAGAGALALLAVILIAAFLSGAPAAPAAPVKSV